MSLWQRLNFFKRTLCFENPYVKGNPITNMKDFEGFVAAFLPGLVYFEFKMVNSRTRRIFTELFQGELFKVPDLKKKILFLVI